MLRIRLLGEFALDEDGERIELPDSARARSLLAWLAVHRGMHARSRVAGRLRPDVLEESARKTLRDAVWALRQALGPAAGGALATERERLGLHERVWTDLGEFRTLASAGRLEEAVRVVGGDLLPALDEDWVAAEREQVRAELADALGRLAAEAETRGDPAAAVRWSRRQAAVDPLAEGPVRELIRRLAAAGERGRALGAYDELAGRLRRELETVPSSETRALVAAVRRGAVAAPSAGPPPRSDADAVRPEPRYVDSAGVSIAYATVGDGPLDLVFVPGFVSHLEVLWEQPDAARFLRRLAGFARVVLWDKREQGLSDRLGRAPTLEQSADDLLAVMDAAGVDRGALFGISEGGPMSLLFAAAHPERVRALALWGAHARVLRGDDYPIGLRQAAVRRTIEHLIASWGDGRSAALFAPSRAHDPAFTAWWGRFLRYAASPRTARQVLELNYGIDVRDLLPAIRGPALVLHARDERLLPLRLAEHLAAELANARLVAVPGADHLPFTASAEPLLAELEAFLCGTPAPGAADRVLATVLFTDADAAATVARHRGRPIPAVPGLSSFDGAARAVRCAAAIVEQHDGSVRAAVHTGECDVRSGRLEGLAVDVAARLGAIAQPGEVIVSGTVRELVAGSGLEFADRGEHALTGVPGRWRLHAVAQRQAAVGASRLGAG